MNVRKYLAAAFAAVCLSAGRAAAAVDSTAFVSLRTDATSMVGFALTAISVVILAVLGIYGLLFAFQRIKARLGRG